MTDLTVFISSRMDELRSERQIISEVLSSLNVNGVKFIPWRFDENAPASSRSIREIYLEALQAADLYIGLFWKTLGTWTVDEYMIADKADKEMHIYIKIEENEADVRDSDLQQFLQNQHAGVRFGFTSKWFTSLDKLRSAVEASIRQWVMIQQMMRYTSIEALIIQSPASVPESPKKLVGRDDLLAQVQSLLAANEEVLLTGMGGVGKSALAAISAAQWLRDHNGVCLWLKVGRASADQIYEGLARVLGLQKELTDLKGLEREQKIRERLSSLNSLLVIDDSWNPQSLAEVKRAFPQNLPLLVTSRRKIPLNNVLAVDSLTPEQALELLAYHARQPLNTDTAARQLCEKLGHHPFALEIAGKTLRVNTLSPADLLQRLGAVPHNIDMPEYFGETNRTGIKSLLDTSINTLNEAQFQAFIVMGGMFSPSSTADLLARVMQIPAEEAALRLKELDERGLVNQAVLDGVEYYRMHDLAYSYAGALLQHEGKNSWRVEQLVDACAGFAHVHEQEIDWLDVERENLLKAAERAPNLDKVNRQIEIMNSLQGAYLTARGHTETFTALMDQAIAALRERQSQFPPTLLHFFLTKRGNIAFERDDLDMALRLYQEALALAREQQLVNREIILLCCVGKVLTHQDDAQAVVLAQQAHDLAERGGDIEGLGMAYELQGYYAQHIKDYAAARAAFAHETALGERENDLYALFFGLLNSGAAEHDLGQNTEALASLKRALEVARQADMNIWEAYTLHSLAQVYHALGDGETAYQHFLQSFRLFKEGGNLAKISELSQHMRERNYPAPSFNA